MLYSEFKRYLREGHVLRVFIGEDTITGELKRLDANKETAHVYDRKKSMTLN